MNRYDTVWAYCLHAVSSVASLVTFWITLGITRNPQPDLNAVYTAWQIPIALTGLSLAACFFNSIIGAHRTANDGKSLSANSRIAAAASITAIVAFILAETFSQARVLHNRFEAPYTAIFSDISVLSHTAIAVTLWLIALVLLWSSNKVVRASGMRDENSYRSLVVVSMTHLIIFLSLAVAAV